MVLFKNQDCDQEFVLLVLDELVQMALLLLMMMMMMTMTMTMTMTILRL